MTAVEIVARKACPDCKGSGRAGRPHRACNRCKGDGRIGFVLSVDELTKLVVPELTRLQLQAPRPNL